MGWGPKLHLPSWKRIRYGGWGGTRPFTFSDELPEGYGKGCDTGPPQVGAGSLSFFGFLWFLVVLLVLPAGFPTFSAIF